MKRWILLALAPLLALLVACGGDPEAGEPLPLARQVATQAFRQLEPTPLTWQQLMPADYRPQSQEFPWMVDDPDAMMARVLEETPLVEELDGREVKVSGYVVPLDGDDQAVTGFLLVPFLGACVHVPPPPANQIVYVEPTYPLPNEEAWGVISVVGKIRAGGRTSALGAVGYQMVDAYLSPFDEDEYAGIARTPVVIDADGLEAIPTSPD